MALVLTLAILALMTLLVIALLSTVTLDRQATANYARSLQADSVALGGLDQVVSQIQAEIADPNNSTNIGTIYDPITNSDAVPQQMSTLAPIVTYSGTKVYGGVSSLASASYTTNAALNNRFVSMNRWYQPQLTPTTTGFPVPQWILMTRTGPTNGAGLPFGAAANSVANNALGNGGYVVGRYAYVVYDTSGLVDINVAGFKHGRAAQRGQ